MLHVDIDPSDGVQSKSIYLPDVLSPVSRCNGSSVHVLHD